MEKDEEKVVYNLDEVERLRLLKQFRKSREEMGQFLDKIEREQEDLD